MSSSRRLIIGAVLGLVGVGLILWAGARRFAPSRGGAGSGPGGPPSEVDLVTLGEHVFKINCMVCHLADGQGQPGQYPPLAGSPWVQGPAYRLAMIPLGGLSGPMPVEDQTFYGIMPTLGPRLTDQQVAAVLTYIRQAWGNKAGPVSPAVVAAARKATDDRGSPWTAAELMDVRTPDLTPATSPATGP